jgi:hypothetical protein
VKYRADICTVAVGVKVWDLSHSMSNKPDIFGWRSVSVCIQLLKQAMWNGSLLFHERSNYPWEGGGLQCTN